MERISGAVAGEILQEERDSPEWPVRRLRGERLLEQRVNDGVQLAVERLDAVDRGFDQLGGRGLARADQFGQIRGVHEGLRYRCR
jgi:hypothetical protein